MVDRHMLEPDRDAPAGWIIHRTAGEMMEALNAADPTNVIEIALRGSFEECDELYAKSIRIATSAYYLLGGHVHMHAIHFHDPCHGKAVATRSHALKQNVDNAIGVGSDTSVPIGGQSLWNRDLRQVLLADATLPETIIADICGKDLSMVVASPMLEEGLTIESAEHDGRNTRLQVRSVRDPRN